ncbi:MAG: hypothetical protein KKF46_07590 [Nanoarchaeota archaeon]|nr:hypothetical protein [Nanoarchaeota archaeon]MBU1322190.1 hypothetical protein [Nanoarchaeota archaeon]MBU1597731.1 hypothetical protein [Nanoarchaeota archaeon]MBU2442113.1 hypothetical protein [Nanoarchaeota archaeon]
MGKPLYKSLYVIAGKREEGTYGIMRQRPSNAVNCFDEPEEAERARIEDDSVLETIVVDIGLLLDTNIKRKGNTLDTSVKYTRD